MDVSGLDDDDVEVVTFEAYEVDDDGDDRGHDDDDRRGGDDDD